MRKPYSQFIQALKTLGWQPIHNALVFSIFNISSANWLVVTLSKPTKRICHD